MSERLATRSDVLVVLSRHVGAANGITAAALACELGLLQRHVRTYVTELRGQGLAVCAHPRTGYFIAATPEELEDTCKFLRSRAMHSLVLESKLRHVPLPDLLGQLRLKT
jgi:biotin operon repressor